MDKLIKFLDKNLDYINHAIIDNTIYINVASNLIKCKCPYCGQYSSKVHSRYKRSFQNLPIQDKKVEIILNNKKYFCLNRECYRKTFTKSFSCFHPKNKKTIRLTNTITKIAMNISSIAAQNYLRDNVVDIDKSTICTLLKKDSIIFDKTQITKVCIDAFALRKRKIYGTVMVGIATHVIVDMIDSRKHDDVVT